MSILPASQSLVPTSFQTQLTPSGSIVSGTATSRTLTALPGGGIQVDDTFVRRSIIQPNTWMQSMAALQACAPCMDAQPAAAPPPAKRKKKKKSLGAKLKRAAKRGMRGIKKIAKSAVKVLKTIHDLPFNVVQRFTGLDLRPQSLLGLGQPRLP